jgi:hypothetical protein
LFSNQYGTNHFHFFLPSFPSSFISSLLHSFLPSVISFLLHFPPPSFFPPLPSPPPPPPPSFLCPRDVSSSHRVFNCALFTFLGCFLPLIVFSHWCLLPYVLPIFSNSELTSFRPSELNSFPSFLPSNLPLIPSFLPSFLTP